MENRSKRLPNQGAAFLYEAGHEPCEIRQAGGECFWWWCQERERLTVSQWTDLRKAWEILETNQINPQGYKATDVVAAFENAEYLLDMRADLSAIERALEKTHVQRKLNMVGEQIREWLLWISQFTQVIDDLAEQRRGRPALIPLRRALAVGGQPLPPWKGQAPHEGIHSDGRSIEKKWLPKVVAAVLLLHGAQRQSLKSLIQSARDCVRRTIDGR